MSTVNSKFVTLENKNTELKQYIDSEIEKVKNMFNN